MSWKENIIVKCFMNVRGHVTNSQAIPSHLLAADTFFIYIWLRTLQVEIDQ